MTTRNKLGIFYKKRAPFHIHRNLPSPLFIANISAQNLNLSANAYGNGIIYWVITNGTPMTKYVVIYRGAKFYEDNATIPPYPFGNAYFPDYAGKILGQQVAIPITDLAYVSNNIQFLLNVAQQVPLGMINNNIVAFVFPVPPYSQLAIPEGGFEGVKEIMYTLVEVVPEMIHTYLIFWNPLQYLLYLPFIAEQGYSTSSVQPVPFPWRVTMWNFTTNVKMNKAIPYFVLKVS